MRREPLVLLLVLVPLPLPLPLVSGVIPGSRLRLRLRLGRLGGPAAYAAVVPWRISRYVLLLGACGYPRRSIRGRASGHWRRLLIESQILRLCLLPPGAAGDGDEAAPVLLAEPDALRLPLRLVGGVDRLQPQLLSLVGELAAFFVQLLHLVRQVLRLLVHEGGDLLQPVAVLLAMSVGGVLVQPGQCCGLPLQLPLRSAALQLLLHPLEVGLR